MKVAAYIALHYGADYLGYAIRSVIDQVDRLIVLYTPVPSYGYNNSMTCPDNRSELKDIAGSEARNKLVWIDIRKGFREGDHRNQAFEYCRNFDILAVVDADEVWEPNAFGEALRYVFNSKSGSFGAHHSGWYHFWRSFNEYCQDGFCPIRFHNLRMNRNIEDINCPSKIYHFGYAQPRDIMQYKWAIHGHQDELIAGWFNNVYFGYQKGVTKGLHPVSMQIWHETKDFDRNTLPDFMHEHPFFNLEKIE